AIPIMGIYFSFYWLHLIRRAWHYQDFQSAMLRAQERAQGLDQLGAYSRVCAIRCQAEQVELSGILFSSSNLDSRYRNRKFTVALIWVFLLLHLVLLCVGLLGLSLRVPAT